jgi:hypothetical protein
MLRARVEAAGSGEGAVEIGDLSGNQGVACAAADRQRAAQPVENPLLIDDPLHRSSDN